MRLIACLAVAIACAGCGGSDEKDPAQPRRLSVDQTWTQRAIAHEREGLALAQVGARRAGAARIEALARSMVRSRRGRVGQLEALQSRLGRPQSGARPADLGVPRARTDAGVTEQQLASAQPFDRVFLQAMQRHVEGALLLAQAEGQRGRDESVKLAAQQLAGERASEGARLARLAAP